VTAAEFRPTRREGSGAAAARSGDDLGLPGGTATAVTAAEFRPTRREKEAAPRRLEAEMI